MTDDPQLNLIERIILRREAMKQFAKYLPTLGALGLGVVHFLLPSLQAYGAQHEKTLVGVLIAALIAAYHLPSPNSK
jgi:hypothetical protein